MDLEMAVRASLGIRGKKIPERPLLGIVFLYFIGLSLL